MLLVRLVPLVIAVAVFVVVFRYLRPRLRANRRKRWEAAGLLPHQVDPYGLPEPESQDRPEHDNGWTRRSGQ